MSKRFKNSRKEMFLSGYNCLVSLDDDNCNLSTRSKFNFSYFCSEQEHACDFIEWGGENACMLLDKLVEYSRLSITELRTMQLGSARIPLLSIYGVFPSHSLFDKPKNIPHQAQWGRFRLDSNKRLIGFIVPYEFHDVKHPKTGVMYDKNTFYVVFIDNDHKFYPLKKS
ncbi:hypothetical protein [Providencia stuartii]|uniref:hypothetical protein n=1 Tax=Providencia stuartii TaxID=588 RepID=UPI00264F6718|nr:hypothetical protein [Providencia stuartii]MDN7224058.1 hypothetical protein [Providencia stuartii]